MFVHRVVLSVRSEHSFYFIRSFVFVHRVVLSVRSVLEFYRHSYKLSIVPQVQQSGAYFNRRFTCITRSFYTS